MENMRQLIAALAAAVLVLSAVSGSGLAGNKAFADSEVTATFGQSSKVELEIDDELEEGAVMGEIKVETEDGDLADGEYAVSLSCESPALEQTLESLEVEDGEGDLDGEVSLANGSTYEGCEVAIGELAVALPSFKVQAAEEDDESDEEEKSNSGKGNNDDDDSKANSRDDDEDEDEDDKRGNNHNATSSRNDRDDDDEDDDDNEKSGSERVRDEKRKFKLDIDDGRAEIEVEVDGISMENGLYDAFFSCEAPAVNMTFADGFEVDDGEGEFEQEFALEIGTYTGCEIAAGDTVIASFGAFTVSEDGDVEQKQEERRKTIVSTVNATRVHERHVNASPASPGNYTQDSDYVLVANGTAESDGEQDNATINATMSIWKSTRGIILLDITGGTVEVGNKTYDVAIGYMLYSIRGDAMRMTALVVGDSGDVMKLKLRGEADNSAKFPQDGGDSLDVSFEGNSGHGRSNSLGDWRLDLEGTIKAS